MALSSLSFCKVVPGGNATLLVHTPHGAPPLPARARIANELMRPGCLGGEQTGFVTGPMSRPVSLAMMGGEFCGNACRALGAAAHLLHGAPADGVFFCSGLDGPVSYEVSHVRGASAQVRAGWNIAPGGATVTMVEEGAQLVEMPGICHLLLDANRHRPPRDPHGESAGWRGRHGLEAGGAAGVVWCAHDPAQRLFFITPVVWVRETGTTCMESACGSATLALALAQGTAFSGAVSVSARQPSGATLEAAWNPAEGRASIAGPVVIAAAGEAFARADDRTGGWL